MILRCNVRYNYCRYFRAQLNIKIHTFIKWERGRMNTLTLDSRYSAVYRRKLAMKRARTTTATSLCETDIMMKPLLVYR